MSEQTIKNPSAVALGKLSRGHKKTISQADRLARIERLRLAREVKRNKPQNTP